MARRSVLFSPGDRPDLLRKAAETDADVLAFDLEDGVAPDRIEAARDGVVEVLSDPDFDPDAEVLVRVNRPDERDSVRGTVPSLADDLDALVDARGAVDGVLLPKVERGRTVRRVAAALRRRSLPRRVLAIVETAAGVRSVVNVADAGATDALLFGAEDLTADLGATRSDEGWEVTAARQRVLEAARAAGVDAIDTLWTAFEDLEGLRSDVERAVDLGYDGKIAIHPDQVGPINAAFTPDEADREWARSVLAAASDAERGGAFAVDGQMIDRPLLIRAERIAARARAAGYALEDAG